MKVMNLVAAAAAVVAAVSPVAVASSASAQSVADREPATSMPSVAGVAPGTAGEDWLRFTVKNDTNLGGEPVDFELFTSSNGKKDGHWTAHGTIHPGQSWSGYGYHVGAFDSLVHIKVDGVTRRALGAVARSGSYKAIAFGGPNLELDVGDYVILNQVDESWKWHTADGGRLFMRRDYPYANAEYNLTAAVRGLPS